MYSHRNRAQLTVSRDRLIEVMESIASDLHLCIDTGTTCCGTCGQRGMMESMDFHHVGYLFWHVQKDDVFEYGGEIWLHHGHRYDNRNKHFALAVRICKALKQHGISHHWTGRINECIQVPVAMDPGFAARRETEWREMMIQNGEDPDAPSHEDDFISEETMDIDE